MSAAAAAQTSITRYEGSVDLLPSGSLAWKSVRGVPQPLADGDRLRTGPGSRCELSFPDGSRVLLGAKTDFTLRQAGPNRTELEQKLGTLRAWVQKRQAQRFSVRTPSVVCAVRGTEFKVEVAADGSTDVSLYEGLLAVDDNAGNELLLHQGQAVEATPTQMFSPSTIEQNRQSLNQSQRAQAASQVSLEMSKEAVLDAATKELKLAVYQQGESLINVEGDRVRVEEYIIRPTPDSFKLVVLNDSAGAFNYFFYQGNFNTALPTNLNLALNELPGCVGAPCQYYETGFETGRSNTLDVLNEIALDGHQVNINGNGVQGDEVTSYFDPALDQYVAISASTPFYETLFDRYALYSDGILKQGWIGNDIQSYDQVVNQPLNADPVTGAPLAQTLLAPTVTQSFSDPTQVNETFTETFADGTFIKYNNYIIDNAGDVAPVSAFANILTGTQFEQNLLNFNYEQVITASEFQGRSIDLVVAPKMLIQAGLLEFAPNQSGAAQ